MARTEILLNETHLMFSWKVNISPVGWKRRNKKLHCGLPLLHCIRYGLKTFSIVESGRPKVRMPPIRFVFNYVCVSGYVHVNAEVAGHCEASDVGPGN